MMNMAAVKALVNSMAAMKFFPSDPAARVALVEAISEIATDESQVRWLVKKLRTDYTDWPGEREMRRLFSTRYRPADGIGYSKCTCGCGDVYSFPLAPNQPWPPQIEASVLLALSEGKQSADAEINAEIKALVRENHVRFSGRTCGPATKSEIARAPAWLRKLEGYDV